MYAYLKGIVESVTEDNLVLEVNGTIGYNIHISAATASCLAKETKEIKIYTYTNVKEDALQLFGFLTKDDLEIFKKLITVNGIGPKGGLAILSVLSPDDLRFAILSGDAKAIAKAPGIGKKTAERVILDLRDKVSVAETFIGEGIKKTEATTQNDAQKEAIEALTALGISACDAIRAVQQIESKEDMDVETILKAALKKIM